MAGAVEHMKRSHRSYDSSMRKSAYYHFNRIAEIRRNSKEQKSLFDRLFRRKAN